MKPKQQTVARKEKQKATTQAVSAFEKKVAIAFLTQQVLSAFSAKLIQLNKQKGWGQADLARRLNIDPSQISRWLAGRQPNMSLESTALLSLAMQCEPSFELIDLEVVEERGAEIELEAEALDWTCEISDDDEWGTINEFENEDLQTLENYYEVEELC
ncbi:helix-turn-helix transcriptional regulator [Methylocystis echinoides]|uniref:helix-turn-helix domain-containing protein n=1 Tax=Methylocystis echinoides TaxID=29468 RepID=UPI0034205CB1